MRIEYSSSLLASRGYGKGYLQDCATGEPGFGSPQSLLCFWRLGWGVALVQGAGVGEAILVGVGCAIDTGYRYV